MRYDVHYQANVLAEQNSEDPEVRKIFPPDPNGPSSLDIFDRYYMYVGTIEAKDLDALFELCQNGGGGIGDPLLTPEQVGVPSENGKNRTLRNLGPKV